MTQIYTDLVASREIIYLTQKSQKSQKKEVSRFQKMTVRRTALFSPE